MSCRCILMHTCTPPHAHRSHSSTHSFPSYILPACPSWASPTEPFSKLPECWSKHCVRSQLKLGVGENRWIDGAERPIWATTDFPYLSSPFFSPPLLFFDSLSFPRCPWEPLIAPLALSALPLCHRMPIAVWTHFKQSMARVAKQSSAGLTAAMASAVNARGLFLTGRAANAFEKPVWRQPFQEIPVSSVLKISKVGRRGLIKPNSKLRWPKRIN